MGTMPSVVKAWWRHEMETFSALLAICAGNSPVNGEFPAQRPVTGSFDVFFDLRLNKQLSKQSWGWWSETPMRSFWRQCNGNPFLATCRHLRKAMAHRDLWLRVYGYLQGSFCICTWKARGCLSLAGRIHKIASGIYLITICCCIFYVICLGKRSSAVDQISAWVHICMTGSGKKAIWLQC